MATTEMNCLVSGGGSIDWLPATAYPTHGVTYHWETNADTLILAFTFLDGSKKGLIYVDLSTPTYIKRGNFSTNAIYEDTLFSAYGLTSTYDPSTKTFTITHVSLNFGDGYVIPLTNDTILP